MDACITFIIYIFQSLGRTHINSCDLSIASYSHDDTEDDFELTALDPDSLTPRQALDLLYQLKSKAREEEA